MLLSLNIAENRNFFYSQERNDIYSWPPSQFIKFQHVWLDVAKHNDLAFSSLVHFAEPFFSGTMNFWAGSLKDSRFNEELLLNVAFMCFLPDSSETRELTPTDDRSITLEQTLHFAQVLCWPFSIQLENRKILNHWNKLRLFYALFILIHKIKQIYSVNTIVTKSAL